jgi:thiol-disulfide isomerase/thioredoxin
MLPEFKPRKGFWMLIIALPLLSLLAALLTVMLSNRNPQTANTPVLTPTGQHSLVDTPAPNFELARLEGENTVRLSSLRGQVVFINFWATWCEPCRREFPAFETFATQDDSPGVILAVNVGDQPEKIEPFLAELGVNAVTVLLDTDFSISDGYEADLFPSTFIVDPAGIVRVVHIGEITGADLQRYAAEYAS